MYVVVRNFFNENLKEKTLKEVVLNKNSNIDKVKSLYKVFVKVLASMMDKLISHNKLDFF